jgi:methyl-accepting chemotaxis protein
VAGPAADSRVDMSETTPQQLTATTQQTALSSPQNAASAVELSQTAEALEGLVSRSG